MIHLLSFLATSLACGVGGVRCCDLLKGCDDLQYDEEKGNEAFADDFQQAMTYFTKLSLRGGEVSLKDAFDWSQSRCVMDVGGGRGECLSHCMLHAGPQCRGVLMDRPWVLDRCETALHRRACNLKLNNESPPSF